MKSKSISNDCSNTCVATTVNCSGRFGFGCSGSLGFLPNAASRYSSFSALSSAVNRECSRTVLPSGFRSLSVLYVACARPTVPRNTATTPPTDAGAQGPSNAVSTPGRGRTRTGGHGRADGPLGTVSSAGNERHSRA